MVGIVNEKGSEAKLKKLKKQKNLLPKRKEMTQRRKEIEDPTAINDEITAFKFRSSKLFWTLFEKAPNITSFKFLTSKKCSIKFFKKIPMYFNKFSRFLIIDGFKDNKDLCDEK